MRRTKTLHAAVALAAAFTLGAPIAALAQQFDAVETIPWPYLGRFPAYPAETLRPTEIWGRVGMLRDSNVFRFSDSVNAQNFTGQPSRGDNILHAGVGVRREQRIVGRQSLRLNARADAYSFNTYSQMDHVGYRITPEWLWEVTNDLAGTVGWDRRKRLVDLAQLQRPTLDMVTEDHAYANGAYRLGPSVRLRAGVDGVRARRSNDPAGAGRVRDNGVTAGADYITPLGNAVGAEVRRTQGNRPTPIAANGTPVDNEFKETEVAGVATWVVSTQLRATGRAGRTKRTHEQFPQLDFQGTTWNAALDWTPLNKTGFTATWYRAPRTIIDITASYVLARGFSIGPRWAPTEKLVFHALFIRERQHYTDIANPVIGSPDRDETVRTWRLGAGWEPVRHLFLSAGIQRGVRSSNGIARDFDYSQYMVDAQYRF